MNKSNKSPAAKESGDPREKRFIIIFLAATAVYLCVCGIMYAYTDINERNAYVSVTPIVSDTVPETEKININTATLEELKSIDGIGDVTAAKIISYREEYNGFVILEELTNISGIGDKLFEKIKPYITL